MLHEHMILTMMECTQRGSWLVDKTRDTVLLGDDLNNPVAMCASHVLCADWHHDWRMSRTGHLASVAWTILRA